MRLTTGERCTALVAGRWVRGLVSYVEADGSVVVSADGFSYRSRLAVLGWRLDDSGAQSLEPRYGHRVMARVDGALVVGFFAGRRADGAPLVRRPYARHALVAEQYTLGWPSEGRA